MRKEAIENVEIVEPPIGELTKQRGSFFKKTLLTGCGCVVFLIALALIMLKIFLGSGPETVKNVPANFPEDIPVYEKDAIQRITRIPGKYKKRSMEVAAVFPKVILSPLLLQLRHESASTSSEFINKNFWKLLTAPVGDARDSVQIEWANMDAEPGFIASYYRKELGKKGYTVSPVASENGIYRLTFEKDNGISGALYAEGDESNRPGTDYASLTINIPVNPSSTN